MEQKKEELLAYICQHIKEYVPEKYQDCDLDTRTVVRANDRKMTGISFPSGAVSTITRQMRSQQRSVTRSAAVADI